MESIDIITWSDERCENFIRTHFREHFFVSSLRFSYNHQLYIACKGIEELNGPFERSGVKNWFCCGRLWKIYVKILKIVFSKKTLKYSERRAKKREELRKEKKEIDTLEKKLKDLMDAKNNEAYDEKRFKEYYKQGKNRRVKKREYGITVATPRSSRSIYSDKTTALRNQMNKKKVVFLNKQARYARMGSEKVNLHYTFLVKNKNGYICPVEYIHSEIDVIGVDYDNFAYYRARSLRLSFDTIENKDIGKRLIQSSKTLDWLKIIDRGETSIFSNDGWIQTLIPLNLCNFFEKEITRGRISPLVRTVTQTKILRIIHIADGAGNNDNCCVKFWEDPRIESNNASPPFFTRISSNPFHFFRVRGGLVFKKDYLILQFFQLRNIILEHAIDMGEFEFENTVVQLDDGIYVGSDFLAKFLEIQTVDKNLAGIVQGLRSEVSSSPFKDHTFCTFSDLVTMFNASLTLMQSSVDFTTSKTQIKSTVKKCLKHKVKGVPLLFVNRLDINPLLLEHNYKFGALIFLSYQSNLDKMKLLKKRKIFFCVIDFKLFVIETAKEGDEVKLDMFRFCLGEGELYKCFNFETEDVEVNIFPSRENKFESEKSEIWRENGDDPILQYGAYYVFHSKVRSRTIKPEKCMLGDSGLHDLWDYLSCTNKVTLKYFENSDLKRTETYKSIKAFTKRKTYPKCWELEEFFADVKTEDAPKFYKNFIKIIKLYLSFYRKEVRVINSSYIALCNTYKFFLWTYLKKMSLLNHSVHYIKFAKKILEKNNINYNEDNDVGTLRAAFECESYLKSIPLIAGDSVGGSKIVEFVCGQTKLVESGVPLAVNYEGVTEGAHQIESGNIERRTNNMNRGSLSNSYLFLEYGEVKEKAGTSHPLRNMAIKKVSVVRITNCFLECWNISNEVFKDFLITLVSKQYCSVIYDSQKKLFFLYLARTAHVKRSILIAEEKMWDSCCCDTCDSDFSNMQAIQLNQNNIEEILGGIRENESDLFNEVKKIYTARKGVKYEDENRVRRGRGRGRARGRGRGGRRGRGRGRGGRVRIVENVNYDVENVNYDDDGDFIFENEEEDERDHIMDDVEDDDDSENEDQGEVEVDLTTWRSFTR